VKQISGKAFARLLQQKGWEHKRTHGSHHIFAKPGHIERISVPVHGNQPLKLGLLRHQMKIAGIDESEL
jgi:predicted RNA binding protein YcfA (HicA-like mRNA interferase family)